MSKSNLKGTELLNKSKQNLKNLELVIKSKQNLLKSSESKSKVPDREKCTKCVDAPSIRRTLKAREDRKTKGGAESSLEIDDETNLPNMVEKLCKCEAMARALKDDLAGIQGMSGRRADIDAMCDLCEDEPVCREPKEEEEPKEGESETEKKK